MDGGPEDLQLPPLGRSGFRPRAAGTEFAAGRSDDHQRPSGSPDAIDG